MKRAHAWLWVGIAAAGISLAAGVWWFLQTPPLQSELSVDNPAEGARIEPGTTISGSATGPGEVRVWVEGVNFAVPAIRAGDSWHYSYQGGLSGSQTLVFALQDGGHWSPDVHVAYVFPASAAPVDAGEPASAHMPEAARSIFRPIENVLRKAVVFVGEAFASGPRMVPGALRSDLDGNGVPDPIQGSPITRIPYGWIALVLVSVLACSTFVLWRKADTWTTYWTHRRKLHLDEAALRARQQSVQAESQSRVKLEVLRQQVRLHQQIIQSKTRLRSQELEVQAQQLRSSSQLAGAKLAGALDLRKMELAGQREPARQGFWARLRGR